MKQLNAKIYQRVLEITGLTDEGKIITLAVLHFSSEELLIHTYLAIIRSLMSGLKIETIEDLLNKTKVPLILPDYVTNTANIIACVAKEYERQIKQDMNITLILNQLEQTEIDIDAAIFLLYGLHKHDVQHICECLNLDESYKIKLLEKL